MKLAVIPKLAYAGFHVILEKREKLIKRCKKECNTTSQEQIPDAK